VQPPKQRQIRTETDESGRIVGLTEEIA